MIKTENRHIIIGKNKKWKHIFSIYKRFVIFLIWIKVGRKEKNE